MLEVLLKALYGVWIFYLLLDAIEQMPFVRQQVRDRARRVWEEMFPFLIPFGLTHYLLRVWVERADNPWFNRGAVLQLALWGIVVYNGFRRGGGGGRWKRRLRRWASRVTVRGARLAVQPSRPQ